VHGSAAPELIGRKGEGSDGAAWRRWEREDKKKGKGLQKEIAG
jgi:hypothetical protein